MILTALLTLAQLVPGSDPLLQHKAKSFPEGSVATSFAADTDYVFQAHGTRISVMRWDCMAACITSGSSSCASCDMDDNFDLESVSMNVDVPVMAMEEANGDLYIAGGDFGAYWLEKLGMSDGYTAGYDTPVRIADSFPAGAITGRWCMDIKVSGGKIFAIFGAKGNSQLIVRSVSDPTNASHTDARAFPLTTSEGMDGDSIGYAVDVLGDYAYLAMGSSGIVRVKYAEDEDDGSGHSAWLTQGPPNYAAACTAQQTWGAVRDLTIVTIPGGFQYIYAAADGFGLLEVRIPTDPANFSATMSNVWSSMTSDFCTVTSSSCVNDYDFGYRVAAVVDTLPGTSDKRVVVGLATVPDGVIGPEISPYTQYGAFGYLYNHPYEDDWPIFNARFGCSRKFQVFERNPASGPPNFILEKEPVGKFAVPHLTACRIDQGGSNPAHIWFADDDLTALLLTRDGSNNLIESDYHDAGFMYGLPSMSAGVFSIKDREVVVFGKDLGGPDVDKNLDVGLYKAEATGSTPPMQWVQVPPPPSDPDQLVFALDVGGSWEAHTSGDESYEWFLSGKPHNNNTIGEHIYHIRRIKTDPSAQDLNDVEQYEIFLQDDPLAAANSWVDPVGRGISFAGVDPRSGSVIAAIARSEVMHGMWLYRHDEIEAKCVAGGDGAEVSPTRYLPLLTHPEAGADEYATEVKACRTYRPKYLTYLDDDTEKWMLAVAAGRHVDDDAEGNFSSYSYDYPNVVFFDVNSLTSLPASTPNSRVVQMISNSNVQTSLAFDVDAATIDFGNDVERSFAFAVCTKGGVSAFDTTDMTFSASGAGSG